MVRGVVLETLPLSKSLKGIAWELQLLEWSSCKCLLEEWKSATNYHKGKHYFNEFLNQHKSIILKLHRIMRGMNKMLQ